MSHQAFGKFLNHVQARLREHPELREKCTGIAGGETAEFAYVQMHPQASAGDTRKAAAFVKSLLREYEGLSLLSGDPTTQERRLPGVKVAAIGTKTQKIKGPARVMRVALLYYGTKEKPEDSV